MHMLCADLNLLFATGCVAGRLETHGGSAITILNSQFVFAQKGVAREGRERMWRR